MRRRAVVVVHDAEAVRVVVERYLQALERFDVDAVLECFSESAFYSHPPYSSGDNGGRRHEVIGHDQLVKLLQHRGPRPDARHEIAHVAIDGSGTANCGFVAGTFSVGGEAAVVGSFVSTVVLAADGRIAAYAAYSSLPAVGAEIS